MRGGARLVAAHVNAASQVSFDPQSLQQVARQDATAAGAEVAIFNAQGSCLPVRGTLSRPSKGAPVPEVSAVLNGHESLGLDRRAGTLYIAVPAGSLVVRLAYPLSGTPAPVRFITAGYRDGVAALAW